MERTLKTLLVLAFTLSPLTLNAQTPTPTPRPRIVGKVVLTESRVCNKGEAIRISVKDRDTKLAVRGEQSATKVEDWFHEVDLGTWVDVAFDPSPLYEGDGHSKIRVNQVNPDLKITLLKSRECRMLEREQERRNKRNSESYGRSSSSTAARSASAGGVASMGRERETTEAAKLEEAMESTSFEVMLKMDPKLDADLIPSPAVLKEELEAAAAHARNGEFFDTFQYKFALKSELYRDIPELKKVLSEFRLKAENATLFQPIGKLQPEMFTDVVRRQFQTSNDVNLKHIRLVVQEEAASEGIRGSATVALLNGTLEEDFRKDITAYYRSQTSDSPIFSNALIALGRIGEEQDVSRLYQYVTNKSADERFVAMQALALTQLIEGPDSLPGGAKTLASVATGDKDPEVRAFAVSSLRPFVYHQDRVALDALFDGANDRNAAVREQVALALGVGQVERGKRVRDLLRKLLGDRSPGVRTAAYLSLTGKLTSGLLIPVAAATR